MNDRAKWFFDTVAEMRKAQRRYFSTRKINDYKECKRIEDVVDAEIARVTKILDERKAVQELRNGNVMKAAAAIAKHFTANK